MIDMSELYNHADYAGALANFNQMRYSKWSIFQHVHLAVSNDKCPICECSLKPESEQIRLSNVGREVVINATIDHYRPQDLYLFLKFAHENYILMCSDCNNEYKKAKFPLLNNTVRGVCANTIMNESPLIVNPINDDLLELFQIELVLHSSGKKVLELKPKATEGYLLDKAIETIKVFGLGDCENNLHNNTSVHNCRITLLNSHFKKFELFIKALDEKNAEQAFHEFKTKQLSLYGFTKLIINKQYKDLT